MNEINLAQIKNGWLVQIDNNKVEYFKTFEDAAKHVIDYADKEEQKKK